MFNFLTPQASQDSYKNGEKLKYRVHYGIFNAAYASLEIKESKLNGKPHFHVVGEGKTTGALRFFFKVDDLYETYIDKATQLPSKFIRKIDEGGYTKNQELTFYHDTQKVKVNDKKNKNITQHNTTVGIQDMISGFYFLRNHDLSKYKDNEFIDIKIFMDNEIYPFRMKILNRETIKTKFGKINCIKIKPYVSKGRVFKADESVTMWITDDENRIPIRIKADLAVGSISADLDQYSNLKHAISLR